MNNKVPNYTYGVDTNDRKAVEAAYKKYRNRHIIITVFAIIVIIALSIIIYDFYQVNVNGRLPLIAKKELVEKGTLYKAIGYKVLYCDNGDKYVGYVNENKCVSGSGNSTYKDILFKELEQYLIERKLIDKTNLTNIEMLDYVVDEVNVDGTTDYLVNLKFTCLDGSNKCFKVGIEYPVDKTVKLITNVDKYNKINSVSYFKSSGNYYQYLNGVYTTNVKDFLINEGKINEDNLRNISVKLTDCYGIYKYNGVSYDKSYRATLNYICYDDTNDCVSMKEDIEFNNMNYDIAILADNDDNIKVIDKSLIFTK